MSETAVMDSSATEVIVPTMEIERGPLVNLNPEQRTEYRKTGILPKKEESAPSPATEGESGTPKQQEKPKAEPKAKQTAEERIAELKATIAKIEKGAGLDKPKAESIPAKPEPVATQAKPTPEDKKPDGTDRFATHEDYIEALTDWKFEQREAKKALEARQEAQNKVLNDKVEEARSRYGDIDALIQASANEIYEDSKISPVVKQMIGDSDLIVDLIYTISNDKAEFAKFTKMAKDDPGKAIRYIALTESLIAQELESKAAVVVEEAPVKPKTQAPKPPAEAGGRAATPPDSMQAALEGAGHKLTPALKAEFARQALAKLKG